MQQFKPDIEEAKLRMAAWWDHESTDRPVISYSYQAKNATNFKMADVWFGAKHPEKIVELVDQYEEGFRGMTFGGENIPNLNPFYGSGIMAAVLGVTPRFYSGTNWFERPTSLNEVVSVLESAKLNANNEWYQRLVKVTEMASLGTQANRAYAVAFTDLGGILDILASFLTPKDIMIAMQRQPALIDTCRAIILEKWLKVYADLQNIISPYNLGYNSWMNVWCPKPWYPLQCDFAYMLSPRLFKRFVLPDLISQAEHMAYSIYHLDGQNQLPYLDDLLKTNITGIQWVPGSQGPEMTNEQWIPVYQKIQAAGKNIVMDSGPEALAKMYRQYDPKGLYVTWEYGSHILAEIYLPKFMGGLDGVEPEE